MSALASPPKLLAAARPHAEALSRAVESNLPPLTVLEPGRQTLGQELWELWSQRELLFFFVWRDVKVRYQQAALGIAWALLQPLTQMVLFAVVFGRYAGLARQTNVPYLWFVLSGLVPWVFFANTLTAASHSMVASRDQLTKVYYPRLAIPCSAVLAGLVDFTVGLGLLFTVLAVGGVEFTVALWALPALLFLLLLTALGAGVLFSAGVAAYRDFRFVVPFILQVGLFATPIIYPPTIFPAAWRWLVALNPLAGIIEAVRACLFGGWTGETTLHLALSTSSAGALLYVALEVFRRMERGLADRI